MNQDDRQYMDNKVFLSLEEERDLYDKMKEGCPDARDDLIMGHKYLVIKLALQYAPYGSYEDLLQEGFVGLIRAVDKYNLEKARVRTYAPRIIQQQMLRFLDKSRHIIRLPEPQTHALLKLLRIKGALEEELGREPTDQELMSNEQVIEDHKQFQDSKKSKLSLKEYVSLLEYGDPSISLNAPISDDSDAQLQDFIEDPKQQSEFSRIENRDLIEVLMDSLEEREVYVLKALAQGVTGQKLGKELNITTQTVSAIKLNAIKKVKFAVKNNPELNELINNIGFEI